MNFLSPYIYVKFISSKTKRELYALLSGRTHAADPSPAPANQLTAFDPLSVSLLVLTRLVFFPRSRWNAYGSQWLTPLVFLLKS